VCLDSFATGILCTVVLCCIFRHVLNDIKSRLSLHVLRVKDKNLLLCVCCISLQTGWTVKFCTNETVHTLQIDWKNGHQVVCNSSSDNQISPSFVFIVFIIVVACCLNCIGCCLSPSLYCCVRGIDIVYCCIRAYVSCLLLRAKAVVQTTDCFCTCTLQDAQIDWTTAVVLKLQYRYSEYSLV